MRIFKITTSAISAGAVALALSGCDNLNGDVVGGEPESATGLVNDGSAATAITDSGNPVPGNFICSHSVSATNPDLVIGTNGLVGGLLTDLLGSLGLDVVTNLLNSVATPEAAADGNLDTAAGVTLTAGLLGGTLSSVDLTAVVREGGTVPSGYYAVAGLSFPGGIANLSLFNSITVRTSLLDLPQEVATLDQSAISLLGINGSTVPSAWVGFKATRPYDKLTISLVPGLLAVNVGNAVRIHEFCYDGRFKIPSAS
ncbi:MAG: hypothetical protein C0434_13270 [Xanthomonadaceae bacterium]|nr:hypothetical protein [Xanthomonadaceae bacterium]